MFNLLSTLICTALLSANTVATDLSPEPKILPFKATALVAQQNRIWVTVESGKSP